MYTLQERDDRAEALLPQATKVDLSPLWAGSVSAGEEASVGAR